MQDRTNGAPLPDALRALRRGVDDDTTIRRLAHLAAAKIEDLELRVSQLTADLAHSGGGGIPNPRWPGAAARRVPGSRPRRYCT